MLISQQNAQHVIQEIHLSMENVLHAMNFMLVVHHVLQLQMSVENAVEDCMPVQQHV